MAGSLTWQQRVECSFLDLLEPSCVVSREAAVGLLSCAVCLQDAFQQTCNSMAELQGFKVSLGTQEGTEGAQEGRCTALWAVA